MHLDAEGARENLGVQLTRIFGLHPIEGLAVVADQPGEDIDAPGRALGIGDRGDAGRQVQRLLQLDHIDAAVLEHGATVEAELVLLEVVELLQHRMRLARQKAGAHAPGLAAEPQVDAGRLDLLGGNAIRRVDLLAVAQRDDLLERQQPGLAAHFDARKIVVVGARLGDRGAEQGCHVVSHCPSWRPLRRVRPLPVLVDEKMPVSSSGLSRGSSVPQAPALADGWLVGTSRP